jgi:Ca2+-binding RTX toxin-like protein
LAGGTGDDSITGGIGNDTILIEDGFGSDVIDASEDVGDGDIDVLDASGLTDDVLMYLTGPDNEAGFIISGADTTGFENVEHVILGSGDDTIFGSTLDDSVTAGAGADTINMGTGNDTVDLGAGAVDGEDDVVILQDDFGNDVVTNFDAPTANPDGQTFASGDLLNVTNLLDLGSNPVETNDVTVGNDGSNNAVLTFPNGESITLVGITPADADNPFYLNALGIPLSLDGIVDGTAVADTIDDGYTGDPDGDLVDANDAILPGDTGDDDVIYGYAGNDTITAGAGNDEVYGGDDNDNIYGGIGNDTLSGGAGNDYLEDGTGDDFITGGAGEDNIALELGNDSADGGAGDDLFEVAANQGNDTIIGGETSETEGDTLALDAAAGANVVADGDESGNATLGSGTVEFSEIEIIATDDGNDTIDLSASSVGMTVLSGDGNDDITGTTGDDEIVAGVGADTINAGAGNDTIDLGDGTPDGEADVIVLEDGFGNDTVTNFDAPIDNGSGNYTVTDTLDVSGLYDLPIGDPDRTPVLTTDVVVTDDGAGNAVLTFPNGEVITLGGVSSTAAADPSYLNALGIPMPDGIVSGTTGNDSIDASYNGDPDGDVVDGNDAILPGHAPNDDSIEAGAGDDLIISGAGDDTIIGGIGDDTVVIGDGFGNHDITGSEGSETDGDTIDGSTLTENVTVDFAAIETGTIDNGNDTVAFNSIENVITGSGNDTVFGGVGSQNVSTGAGDDTIQTTGTGADTIDTGAGDDAITFSEGDSISGGTGNDTFTYENLFEPENGTITIVGGQGVETPDDGNPLTSEGDTLQLGENADMSTLNITSTTVNGDGNTSYAGTIQLDDGTLLVFSEIENIICFTPGTRISTPFGARDIATLKVGDLVLTLDHGPQPIRWIQKRTVPAIDRFAPIRIKPGVVAGQERDLLVSPQHRMMFEGYRAQLLFGESQILVAAKHLVDDSLVTQETGGEVTYIHMLFDEHEVVFAEGAPTESFHPGDLSLSAVSDPAREELFSLFPELRSNVGAYGQTARRCLRGHEGQLLTA